MSSTRRQWTPGRCRWRTKLRVMLPWALTNVVSKGSGDCGNLEWYNADGQIENRYHCESVSARTYRIISTDARPRMAERMVEPVAGSEWVGRPKCHSHSSGHVLPCHSWGRPATRVRKSSCMGARSVVLANTRCSAPDFQVWRGRRARSIIRADVHSPLSDETCVHSDWSLSPACGQTAHTD
jgi:hypothetical protein